MSVIRPDSGKECVVKSTKRAKRSHEMIDCVIELENGIISRDLTAKLTVEIIKYLLYDRQQIPFPMTNSRSLDKLQEKSATKQLSSKEEQTIVMFQDLNRVLDEVICLLCLDNIRVESVSLSLGQTLQMPKELYCLELPAPDIYCVQHSTDCPKQSLRTAVTRFFKTILNDVNILSQNRKDIQTTKMFVLIKINKCFVQQVMEHSSNCHQLSKSGQHFTPHIEYEIPRIGNRFRLVLRQKQCNCNNLSDNSFEIYEESFCENRFTTNDSRLEHELSQTMSDVLTFNEDITEKASNQTKEEFVWIQILSSIKGIQLNSNKNIY